MNNLQFWATNKKLLFFSVLIFIITIASLTLNSGYASESNNEDLVIKLDEKVNKFAVDYKFNGNILIAKGERIFLNKSYGAADFENNIMNTPQTRFLIASITKQFTATIIMQLQEKGLLSIEDTIDKYVTGFPKYGDQITIHHLLTHTSGLPRDINLGMTPSSLSEALEIAKSKPFEFVSSPGRVFSYSNVGYILLGYIIEQVSGKPYQDYLQDNIFTPLNMTNSGFGYDRRNDKKLALSYGLNNECLTKNPFIDLSVRPHAAGAIYSTTEDLYKWDRALYTNIILSEKSLKKMFTVEKNNYGYGWFIYKKGDKTVYTHNGIISGFRSLICRRVDENICIIALSNRSNFDEFDGYILENIIMDVFNSK